jgi:hypothetical protein
MRISSARSAICLRLHWGSSSFRERVQMAGNVGIVNGSQFTTRSTRFRPSSSDLTPTVRSPVLANIRYRFRNCFVCVI